MAGIPGQPRAIQARARLFHGLADPSRMALLEALRDGPLPVGDLGERAGLSQPNTSNHLACLLECGLVGRKRQGRRVFYALADPGVEEILRLAEAVRGRSGSEAERGVPSGRPGHLP